MLNLDTLFFCTLIVLTLTLLLNSCVYGIVFFVFFGFCFLITIVLYVLFVRFSIINISGVPKTGLLLRVDDFAMVEMRVIRQNFANLQCTSVHAGGLPSTDSNGRTCVCVLIELVEVYDCAHTDCCYGRARASWLYVLIDLGVA